MFNKIYRHILSLALVRQYGMEWLRAGLSAKQPLRENGDERDRYCWHFDNDPYDCAGEGQTINPDRPSYRVMKYLPDQAITLFPVSPKVAGKRCWGSRLARRWQDVPEKSGYGDNVFRNSGSGVGAAQEAITIGAKTLRMQLGVINEQAAVLARDAGMMVVMDRCPAVEILGWDWRSGRLICSKTAHRPD